MSPHACLDFLAVVLSFCSQVSFTGGCKSSLSLLQTVYNVVWGWGGGLPGPPPVISCSFPPQTHLPVSGRSLKSKELGFRRWWSGTNIVIVSLPLGVLCPAVSRREDLLDGGFKAVLLVVRKGVTDAPGLHYHHHPMSTTWWLFI